MRTPEANLKAAILLAGAMACFTLNDSIIKLLSSHLPIGEMLLLRGIIIIAILVTVMICKNERFEKKLALTPANLTRSMLEVLITFTFLYGVINLPLAIATTLIYTAPIFITIFGSLFFNERVGVQRWTAIVAGFVGVVLIADPQTGFEPLMLFPIAAAFMTAGRDVLTRLVPVEMPARAVALSTALAVTTGGILSAPLGGWAIPTGFELMGLAACGVLLASAYTLLVSAVRMGEISFIAPFRYISIVLALALGFFIWGEVPSKMAALGGCIVIGSGLFIFHRERNLVKKS